jgi:hypothetical protein
LYPTTGTKHVGQNCDFVTISIIWNIVYMYTNLLADFLARNSKETMLNCFSFKLAAKSRNAHFVFINTSNQPSLISRSVHGSRLFRQVPLFVFSINKTLFTIASLVLRLTGIFVIAHTCTCCFGMILCVVMVLASCIFHTGVIPSHTHSKWFLLNNSQLV